MNKLSDHLASCGFRGAVVPVERLGDLESEMIPLFTHKMDKGVYNDYLSKISFKVPDDYANAQSIIIIAAQQPKVTVTFHLDDRTYPVLIPPTYSYEIDKDMWKTLTKFLNNYGYTLKKAILPDKSLSVHSGLARYGKNNITYFEGWGSFVRQRIYFSDMPCPEDNWQELEVMDACHTCNACVRKCPTKAIRSDEFVIQAERCLTYWNESPYTFPGWVNPSWHNSLIGCMICQDVCPQNKAYRNNTIHGGEFSADDTQLILEGVPMEHLPDKAIVTLKHLGMDVEYHVLQRNLSAIIKNR